MGNNDKQEVTWYYFCTLRNTSNGQEYSGGSLGVVSSAQGEDFVREVREAIKAASGWSDDFVLLSLSRL